MAAQRGMRGSTELTPAAEMGDPPPAMARTQHQRKDEERLDRLRVPKGDKEALLSPAQGAIETQPKLSAEKSLRQFAAVLADLERLVNRPPTTLRDALKELRTVANGLAAVVAPWVSRILGHYRGSRYETLQEKRAIGSDVTAAVKGFGLTVLDRVSGVAGSLYARHDRSEPSGKFCIEYVKDGKSNSRVLGESLPEIVLTPTDTSPRKSRVLPGSVANSNGPE